MVSGEDVALNPTAWQSEKAAPYLLVRLCFACTKVGRLARGWSGYVLQELKAALDEAIASLARRPDLAAALWERLVAAVVVSPASTDNPAVPRYDLSYQLNEIEVR